MDVNRVDSRALDASCGGQHAKGTLFEIDCMMARSVSDNSSCIKEYRVNNASFCRLVRSENMSDFHRNPMKVMAPSRSITIDRIGADDRTQVMSNVQEEVQDEVSAFTDLMRLRAQPPARQLESYPACFLGIAFVLH